MYAVYVNRPIRRIADFVKQAAAGDAASLPPALLQRRDEIGGLARDLDIMLSRQSAHLARQHQIVRDITHELRSPLARLRVATSLLAGRNGADDGRLADAAAVGDQVETDIATLDGLIDRILMLARLDSPDWRNKLELFDIRDLFREAADRAKGACKAQAGGAAPATGLYVRGDRRLLGEAMAHLIDHICGLAGSRSPVRLELRHEALQARLRILLDGPNIRSRGLRKLTEPASTGDSGDGAVDPADIGLVIARRIAEMHGGEIVALPRWLPQGVAIEMTVPLAFNPVAAAA